MGTGLLQQYRIVDKNYTRVLLRHFVESGKFFCHTLRGEVHVPLEGLVGRVPGQLHYELRAHTLS